MLLFLLALTYHLRGVWGGGVASPPEIRAMRALALALPRRGPGPYCLGAAGTLALQGSFKSFVSAAAPAGDTTRPAAKSVTLVGAPRSGMEWLASALERGGHYAYVHTSHYPFFDADLPPRVANDSVILVLRNVFDAHRAYKHQLASLNANLHRKRTPYPALSLDEFAARWAKTNHHWAVARHPKPFLVHYEHLQSDPGAALKGAVGTQVNMNVSAAFAGTADMELAPPRLVEHGVCAHALHHIDADVARHIVDTYHLAEYGYSLVQAAVPWGETPPTPRLSPSGAKSREGGTLLGELL